jgi:hypothetical protein
MAMNQKLAELPKFVGSTDQKIHRPTAISEERYDAQSPQIKRLARFHLNNEVEVTVWLLLATCITSKSDDAIGMKALHDLASNLLNEFVCDRLLRNHQCPT